jgi:hypothetical protein
MNVTVAPGWKPVPESVTLRPPAVLPQPGESEEAVGAGHGATVTARGSESGDVHDPMRPVTE